jgi:hypothetical protein
VWSGVGCGNSFEVYKGFEGLIFVGGGVLVYFVFCVGGG